MNNALLIKDVGKRFGDTWVLQGVRAAVPKGKITAFVGPNGAGKTTLFHVIAGALKPDEGQIIYEGKEITGQSPHIIAQNGLGRQFQDVRVFKALTALDNVMASLISIEHQRSWRAWYRPIETNRTQKALKEEALHWLDYVGLSDEHAQPAGVLSFGQQKLLSLARLFAKGFQCILLDEPTSGVAPKMVEQIVELIRQRVQQENLTAAAFVEHNMTAVEHLADWIHFLHDGHVAFSGRADHVLGHRTVREMYMGI
jgi:branched-chain amino acid transport system ATP-binding protein